METYIVTGAAGHLGSAILQLLKNEPVEVRALLFGQERPKVTGENILYYRGDVTDKGSLLPLFEGLEPKETTVLHTAALISIQNGISKQLYDTNVNGVRNVADLCAKYHVKRLVHVSSVHAMPEQPKGTIQKEISSYDPDKVVGGYAKTKALGARIVTEHMKDLDAVIVLPSGIIGPGDAGRNHLVQMTREWTNGRLPACVPGGYDFVDVRDVAKGCLAAARKGRAGESYLLTGHYSTIEAMLNKEAEWTHHKKVTVLPMSLAKAALPLISLYCRARKTRPLYTAYSLYTLGTNALFSHEKATRELGYTVRDLDESLRDMVEELNGNQKEEK